MSKLADVAITTLQSIFIIASISGNSLVCAIIKRNRHMRIPINYLLVNLAVADSFFATFHTTEVVYSHIDTHPDGVAGKVACVFRNSVLQWIGASASTFTVVAIAVERYFAVMYPYQNKKKLTMEKVKVIIAISWIASLIKNIPKFSLVFYKSDVISCKYTEEWIGKVYFSALFSINAFSFMLIAGLYSRVMYTLWFQRPENDDLRTTQQQGVLKVRKRVTLMLLTVSAIFGICWTTDIIAHSLDIFGSNKPIPYAIPIAHTMLMFNAAVNPFVYALMSRRFREKTKEMLCLTSASKVHPLRKPKDGKIPHDTKQKITPC